MKDNTTRRLALGLLGGALLLGSVVGVAVATGVPTSSPLVWGGTVTDDAGKPYDKAVEVSVAFYDGQAATTPVCESQTVNAEAKTGRFSVVLPDACAKAVHDSPDLWSETVVGPSKTKLPRVKVAAVPYALEAAVAGVAEKAGGALAGEISGLSGKVDGVVKDVADLKAGGGGGSAGTSLVVKDANGVVLGVVLDADGGMVNIVTKTGYVLQSFLAQPASDAFFSDAGCKSNPFIVATWSQMGVPPAHLSVTVGAAGLTRCFVPASPTGALVVAKKLPFASRLDYDAATGAHKCVVQTSQSTHNSAVPAVEVSAMTVGLPDKIVYPLSVGLAN